MLGGLDMAEMQLKMLRQYPHLLLGPHKPILRLPVRGQPNKMLEDLGVAADDEVVDRALAAAVQVAKGGFEGLACYRSSIDCTN